MFGGTKDDSLVGEEFECSSRSSSLAFAIELGGFAFEVRFAVTEASVWSAAFVVAIVLVKLRFLFVVWCCLLAQWHANKVTEEEQECSFLL